MKDVANTNFDHRIYIRDPDWCPPRASIEVEQTLKTFRLRIKTEQSNFNKRNLPNITVLQNYALRHLVDHKKFIIIWADKNMGVVIMLRDAYIKQCIKEHFGTPKSTKISPMICKCTWMN